MSKKIGFIPLRKNSKGIPNKNKKKMVGRPLFCWVLSEAIFSELDEVYVFTNDTEIIDFINKEYHWTSKVKTLLREEINANDTASTESALIEFSEKINQDYELLCLLQATSPLTTSKDINNAINKIKNDGFDSVLSVVKTHRFTWNLDGTAQNYDVFNRPRRQDFDGLLIENGAIYITKKEAFLSSKNRVSGNIGLIEMPEDTLVELDSLTDWLIVENLLTERLKKAKKTQRIEYLVLDVDGVFTDGGIYYNAEGELAKKFDMRDGMGLEILRENKVVVVVLTAENSALVAQRMKKLNIQNTFLGVKDKYSFLQQFLVSNKSSIGAVAYIGDDVNDLANLCNAGWSFAPNNATNAVKPHVDMVLNQDSANGAIREACEFILKYNKRYESV
ncbi:MAG: acylneuraminate cytidylyltransferase [Flavobacteriaceae bacterium]|nr:acylneuraminate cytidylyltransferase [Flavobacteriaceae bacterium]